MLTTTFLTIEHAERAIGRSAVQRRLRQISRRIGSLVWMALCAAGLFLILSAPAQYERLVYSLDQWLNSSNHSQQVATPFNPAQFLDHQPTITPVEVPIVENNHLVIPAIGVNAPILWNVPIVDSLNGLQQGVVQVSESYLPGEAGRTFIVGHSSGFWWLRNPWTKVFSLLDKLKPGDLIFLRSNNQLFAYKVVGQETVSPSNVAVIRDDLVQINQLSLMTCTPVGTSINRLIVSAEPILIESGTGQ